LLGIDAWRGCGTRGTKRDGAISYSWERISVSVYELLEIRSASLSNYVGFVSAYLILLAASPQGLRCYDFSDEIAIEASLPRSIHTAVLLSVDRVAARR
jgi:hypothetical protein